MAALNADQQEIELDKIYLLEKFSDDYRYASPSIFIKGDTTARVIIYTDEETPAVKGDMHLEHTDISGHKSFLTIPNYIYVEQSDATVDAVILTGIKATEVV